MSVNGTPTKGLPRYVRTSEEAHGGSRFSALDTGIVPDFSRSVNALPGKLDETGLVSPARCLRLDLYNEGYDKNEARPQALSDKGGCARY